MAFLRRPLFSGLFKWGGISLAIHIALLILLSFNPWPTLIETVPIAYTVTLMPVSLPEPEIPKPPPEPKPKKESPKPVEKPTPVKKREIEKPKKEDIVEKVKKAPPKPEPPEKKVDLKHLQDELEKIRKKAKLDELRKKVAERPKAEEQPPVTPPVTPRVPPPVTPPITPIIPPLTPPATPPSVPQVVSSKRSPGLESKMRDLYYSQVCAQIKESWTLPENLIKEMVDLETIIVLIIERNGKIQKWWFEKKSGNTLYDQMAMRAILKADPLPPIPKELGEEKLEIGIKFFPE